MNATATTPTGPRYSGVAIAFHWLLALMIIVSFSVGWYMTGLSMSPTRLKLFNWH
jgi:cytochrome b561